MKSRRSVITFTAIVVLGVVASAYADTTNTREKSLLGKRMFGVQFIWDGYGTALIKQADKVLTIDGAQYSKDKKDYCKINGQIEVINERKFKVIGQISTNINSCCGQIENTGEFVFLRSGKRKYWRLQDADKFCDRFKKCAYYIDIFQ